MADPAAMDVKTLCLGVLTNGDMAGYDIKKYFEEAFSHFFVAGFGSIYPALAELTRDGLVNVASVSQEKRPDKKVYSLTEAGRDALEQALLQTEPRHKVRSEFLVLMYFAHLLPRQRLAQVMDQQAATFAAVLETLDHYERQIADGECNVPPGVRFTVGYGQAVMRTALDYIRNNRDGLLEDTDAYTEDGAEVCAPEYTEGTV